MVFFFDIQSDKIWDIDFQVMLLDSEGETNHFVGDRLLYRMFLYADMVDQMTQSAHMFQKRVVHVSRFVTDFNTSFFANRMRRGNKCGRQRYMLVVIYFHLLKKKREKGKIFISVLLFESVCNLGQLFLVPVQIVFLTKVILSRR